MPEPSQKSLVILQSNYIPWKGYFDLMMAADEFVVFDEVQYTRRDWRNRNKIIINGAPAWLTIAVQSKGNYDAPIDAMVVSDAEWARDHWRSIDLNYRKAAYFGDIAPALERAYLEAAGLERLTDINELFLKTLAGLLQIATPIVRSNIVPRTSVDPTQRLVEICSARGATEYISGPAARAYIDREAFTKAGVSLSYANYDGYPVYDQASSAFEHGVSIIDVLMRCGRDGARAQFKSFRDRASFVEPT